MTSPTNPFTILPAIDLRRGQVVRLRTGDPSRQTTYSDDPGGTARRWLAAGAVWLHVVNLDGAFGEAGSENRSALQGILTVAGEFGASVQFGGGLRSLASIERALELGVSRVILGTLAVEHPEVLSQAIQRWGAERVGAGLDARAGKVAVRGWQENTSLSAGELALQLQGEGLRWLVFTDISHDGLEDGVNLEATLAIARASGLEVIASGGTSSLGDVRRAREAGLAGLIVGQALYSGALDPQALFDMQTTDG